jgi:putative membrane protein insertion efficiency factor
MLRSPSFAAELAAPRPTFGVRVALVAVHAYQLLLSPFTGGACRFTPSCSDYAIEALNRHGAWKGLRLAVARVARCHPFGSSGIDPVPPAE